MDMYYSLIKQKKKKTKELVDDVKLGVSTLKFKFSFLNLTTF